MTIPMHMRLLSAISSVSIAAILHGSAQAAEDDPMASGVSVSYIHLMAGSVDAGPASYDWDSGYRVELQFRDYYFAGQNHHPFYELGLILEDHSMDDGSVSIQAETLGIKAAIGTAIPLGMSSDTAYGLAPLLSAHVGKMTFDVSHQGGQSSSNDALRSGLSLGCDGWAVFNRSVTVGFGPFLSYWRSQSLEVANASGGTDSVSPTGWDVGARLLVGVIF